MSSSVKLKTESNDNKGIRAAPETNKRILVVDDEVSIADGIRTLLCPITHEAGAGNVIPFRRSSRSAPTSAPEENNEVGYEVTVVHNPQDALQAVKNAIAEGRPYAMGFFDVMLGADIDGIELVKLVQVLDPEIYAVFVTAYHDRSVDSIDQYLGGSSGDRWDYINKPFTEGEIIQKARNMTALWNLKRTKAWQEERLDEAQKMLLQNERLNTVAAVGRSVAHEFGNLLMQIVGHAELAMLKKDEARMREALETILKASDTATEVLARFKKMSQGDDSEKPMQLLQICQPLDEAVELMGYQFKKHHIDVIKGPYEMALIEGHRHSLVQVMMNLFINAVHVMPDGGHIYLSAKKVSDQKIEIKVRDQGPGIPPENLEKVMEPLFTTKGALGSGLGLAICREIVEIEHRGVLKIENHSAGGVEVTVELPTRQGEDE